MNYLRRLALQGEKKTWWQLASRCCWNRTRPWHASELVSFLVGLRTYQHPGMWRKIRSFVRILPTHLGNGRLIIHSKLFVYKRWSNHITGQNRPWGFQEVEVPRFQDNRHMKVVRLSALRTDRLYPPGNIPGTHFCQRPGQPQGHSAAGRIKSMKNSNDNIGNRTRDLSVCNAVP